MLRLATLLLALAVPAAAQDFPGPGEGAFSWSTRGDERVEGVEIVFPDDGAPLVFDGNDLARYADGVWQRSILPNFVGLTDAVLPLRGDTLIAGPRVARSPDGGLTWEYPCGEGGPSLCDRAWIDGSHNIAEISHGPYAGRLLAGGALYSDDRGASWHTATVHANETNWGLQLRAFAPLPSGRVLGAGAWGVAFSDTGGEDWTPTDLFEPYQVSGSGIQPWATPGSAQAHAAGGPAPACGLAEASLCEGAVAVGTDGSEHVRTWWTNDGGRTWAEGSFLPQVYDSPGYSRVALLRELDRAGTDAAGGAGAGRGVAALAPGFFFATVDGGVTWDVVARAPSIGGGDPDNGGIMLAAEIGPDGRIYTVQTQSNIDEYVWLTSEPAAAALAYVTAGEASGAPEAEALGVSVRPNPSRGAVVVELRAAEATEVRAVVVDARGRRVAELFAGPVAGARELAVDTSGWASGVYTVVVEAGGARRTEAFTVAR